MKIWDTRDLKCVAEIDVSEDSGAVRGAANNLTFLPDGLHLAMYYVDVYPAQFIAPRTFKEKRRNELRDYEH